MNFFDKLSALLPLLLFISIKDTSSVPLLREIQGIENPQTSQEENFANVDFVKMINSIFDNWLARERLAAENSLEDRKRAKEKETLQKPEMSNLPLLTKRPVTLGYWNWHWRRK